MNAFQYQPGHWVNINQITTFWRTPDYVAFCTADSGEEQFFKIENKETQEAFLTVVLS